MARFRVSHPLVETGRIRVSKRFSMARRFSASTARLAIATRSRARISSSGVYASGEISDPLVVYHDNYSRADSFEAVDPSVLHTTQAPVMSRVDGNGRSLAIIELAGERTADGSARRCLRYGDRSCPGDGYGDSYRVRLEAHRVGAPGRRGLDDRARCRREPLRRCPRTRFARPGCLRRHIRRRPRPRQQAMLSRGSRALPSTRPTACRMPCSTGGCRAPILSASTRPSERWRVFQARDRTGKQNICLRSGPRPDA